MNDTPRTDAEVFLLFKTGDDEGVTADFARKLERENAALRAMLQRADDTLDVCRVKSAALIRRDIADVLARKEAQS